MHQRIYVCHTYYHVYVTCLKELALPKDRQGKATLVLSTMSNDFRDLPKRAQQCPLFEQVLLFEEKQDSFFPELKALKTDTGNLVRNMWNRMRFLRRFGTLQEPYVPVDFRDYEDIYVYCDSDPIGYYLSSHHIRYHALEDGLDCLKYYDTARYDNRGHFKLKAAMARLGLIFIQNGYGKYCIDMEVNDLSALQFPGPKYIEQSREKLAAGLNGEDRKLLTDLFIENKAALLQLLDEAKEKNLPTVLVLSEPLCDLETRKRLFADLIRENGTVNGTKAQIIIKPHPRDVLDYRVHFPEHLVLDPYFPMEILNYVEGIHFDKVVTVYTVPSSIHCADEKVYLGDDFMDRYEAPEIHRQNEQIT